MMAFKLPPLFPIHKVFSVVFMCAIFRALLSTWLPCSCMQLHDTTLRGSLCFHCRCPLWVGTAISRILFPEASKATILRVPDPYWIPYWSSLCGGMNAPPARALHLWTWRSPPVLPTSRDCLFGLSTANQLFCNPWVPRSITNQTRPVNMSGAGWMWAQRGSGEVRPSPVGEVTCFSSPPLQLLTCGNESLALPEFSKGAWNLYLYVKHLYS